MLKEPPQSVWPTLAAEAVEMNSVLGTVVSLGAPGTLRTWDIPAMHPRLHCGCQKHRACPALRGASKHQPPCKPAGTA